ncbi:uncharacterized protein LOC127362380 [Dicentrarchus labrax]|uniref:uncharacterized protein LOC127362380 n=1 Tax=Dicentrarchus labrax TaxID=13489 RepID=UPI0021F64624|nr:uncharacterized protein LOC127362380 [Dicentrarchus labrax]
MKNGDKRGNKEAVKGATHKETYACWRRTVCMKGQSRLYFLKRLGSFNICKKLLQMFYQSVVASVLFYAVVCWGGSSKRGDAGRLDRLVRRAGSVVGTELDSLVTVAERRTLDKLLSILDNAHHPLHDTFTRQRSVFSGRLLSQSSSTNRLKNSFVPHQTVQQLSVKAGRTTDNRQWTISVCICTFTSICTPLHLHGLLLHCLL